MTGERRSRAGTVKRGRARAVAMVALFGLTAVATACEDDPSPEPAEPAPVVFDAATYVKVIARFLPPSLDPENPPVVYVVPVSGESLDLDNQVAVIEELQDRYDVRFVDEPKAAVDEESVDEPPRDEGTLIGLGRISATPPHTVRVELYRDRDRVSAHLLTLRNENDSWIVAESETVAPEVLIGDG